MTFLVKCLQKTCYELALHEQTKLKLNKNDQKIENKKYKHLKDPN